MGKSQLDQKGGGRKDRRGRVRSQKPDRRELDPKRECCDQKINGNASKTKGKGTDREKTCSGFDQLFRDHETPKKTLNEPRTLFRRQGERVERGFTHL